MAKIGRFLPWIPVVCLLSSCAVQRPFSATDIDRRIVSAIQWAGTPIPDHAKPRRHTVRLLTLHHGGEDFPAGRDVPQHLRNLQAWSRREKHWADIPYHYIIDLQGRTYACRPLEFAGDTNTEYDPGGHALVCVLGNYDVIAPTPLQLRAVEELFTMLCVKFNLGPETIASHKDYSSQTACPGRSLYARLGEIQAGVRRRLAGMGKAPPG